MNISELNQKVLNDLEKQLDRHKILAKYTKKTTKLNNHLFNIRFTEEVIEDYKQEYGI